MASQAISNGRASQKSRTRKALVDAARQLIQEGKQPTVTDAAEAAGISRATAYRYFPTQEMLLAEVALFASGGPLSVTMDKTLPAPEAVAKLVRDVGEWSYANEQPLRTLLRLSLDPSSGVKRPGHRRGWIAGILAPARDRMDAKAYRNLSHVLSLFMGIDPIVAMTDIAGASKAEALDALEWSARALVEAAIKARR